MTETKFVLERSAYFNNRSKLLTSNGVPKLSDAKANLGDSLAKVVFEQCDEALREDFGLKLPLNGPGDVLWVSPSDLLVGKIALKPPFTPKCLQALTHKGILEIGEDLEKRFRQEMELDKQKTLEKYKAELLATVENRMKSEIKDVEIRERLMCHMELEKQQQEFDLILKEELDKLEKILQSQYEQVISRNEELIKQVWKEKLQEEVNRTIDNMTIKFLAQLDEQEQKLTRAFKLELRKREILREFDAKSHRSKMNDALRLLKHSLECKSLVNMMYVLCTERRKCCRIKEKIEHYYQKIIDGLRGTITQKDNEITKLTHEKNHQIKEVHLREICLNEVIKSFQKFIYFALRAAPTQAEFLLSVEKMMAFELTNTIAKSEFPEAQLEGGILPWNQEHDIETPSVLSDLEIYDHHNCLNELNPPTPKYGSEIGEDGTLPAMYFNNKLYVREDFRDMLSTGIEITPSNEIWSHDVEILIENWRKQSTEPVQVNLEEEKGKQEQKEEAESVEIYSEKQFTTDDRFSINNERRRSKQSTVQFRGSEVVESKRGSAKSVDSRKACRKSSLRHTSYPTVENEQFEPATMAPSSSTTKILAAKDSLEIIMEQNEKSGLYITALDEEQMDNTSHFTVEEVRASNTGTVSRNIKELVVETRDSVILRKSSLAKHQSSEFNISPRDSIEIAKHTLDKEYEVKTKPSKLSCARNSVEILKESIFKLKEPALICQRKDQQQNTSSSHGFVETCCEYCKRKESLNIFGDPDHKNGSIMKPDSFSSAKMSRVQALTLDDHTATQSVVSFHVEPIIFATPSSSDCNVESKRTNPLTRKKKLKKTLNTPNRQLKVIGDRQDNGDQSTDQFTADRIHSLINLMKDHPPLLQLFTAGSR